MDESFGAPTLQELRDLFRDFVRRQRELDSSIAVRRKRITELAQEQTAEKSARRGIVQKVREIREIITARSVAR